MQCKSVVTCTNPCACQISPNGKHLAYTLGGTLRVQSLKSSKTQEFVCLETIDRVEWSPDSEFVLCVVLSRCAVHVFSLENPDWRCKIDQGSDGLEHACWTPDSRHIITTVKLQLWASIWSLSNKTVKIIENLKTAYPGLDFSPDGKLLGVVESRRPVDCIVVLSCSSWKLVKRLEFGYSDLGGFCWNYSNTAICAWEISYGNRLKIVDTDNDQIAEVNLKIGINSVLWRNDIVIVSCADDSILLINSVTWNVITKFQNILHLTSMTGCSVFQEVQIINESVIYAISQLKLKTKIKTQALISGKSMSTLNYKLVTAENVELTAVSREVLSMKLRSCGISEVSLSSDSQFLACRSFYTPSVMWIWDLKKLALRSVLVHHNSITSMQWEPGKCRLLICTSSQSPPSLFMWTPDEATVVPVPELGNESVTRAQWHPFSSTRLIVVNSRTKMVVCKTN